jgi:hypothetical protein
MNFQIVVVVAALAEVIKWHNSVEKDRIPLKFKFEDLLLTNIGITHAGHGHITVTSLCLVLVYTCPQYCTVPTVGA